MKFDMPTCGACRTCEMGCSFKHEQEFNPSISSIKILDKEDGPGYTVWIVEEGEKEASPATAARSFPFLSAWNSAASGMIWKES